MKEISESFVFYASYFEAVKRIKTKKNRLLLFETICEYALNGIEPEENDKIPDEILSYFILIKPTIDTSKKRYKASVINGSKGGAPKGNKNAKKQPRNNLNDNDNDNENENDNVNDNENVNVNVAGKPTHAHGRFQNVFLTDEELEQLKAEFPNTEATIDKLSEYMESSGKEYSSHYATLCKWAREDKEKQSYRPTNKAEPKETQIRQRHGIYL